MKYLLILAILAGILAGCGPVPTPPAGPGLYSNNPSQPTASLAPVILQADLTATPMAPALGTPGVGISLDLGAQIDQARRDLAQRVGIPAESVTVAGVLGNDFSNAAFYCLKTTERIARDDNQPLISGEFIFLTVSGKRYEYHASDQAVVFCRQMP